jgi:hypothetical protein
MLQKLVFFSGKGACTDFLCPFPARVRETTMCLAIARLAKMQQHRESLVAAGAIPRLQHVAAHGCCNSNLNSIAETRQYMEIARTTLLMIQ